jgi:putative transposase
LATLLPAWKQEFGWPSDVPAQALQQSLKDLDQAYINFFKDRANSPVFRKKSKKDSFRIPQGFEVDSANGRVKLPKLGYATANLGTWKGSLRTLLSRWETARFLFPLRPSAR